MLIPTLMFSMDLNFLTRIYLLIVGYIFDFTCLIDFYLMQDILYNRMIKPELNDCFCFFFLPIREGLSFPVLGMWGKSQAVGSRHESC